MAILFRGRGTVRYLAPILADNCAGIAIEDINATTDGISASTLSASHSTGVTIRNDTFVSSTDNVLDRMHYPVEMIGLDDPTGTVDIEGNTIIDSPQIGIWVGAKSDGSPDAPGLLIHGNTIESNSIVSDSYGILLNDVSYFKVYDNTITAGLGKSSRGIMLDGNMGGSSIICQYGEIYNNYVDIRERPNAEYGLGASYPATALRLRDYDDAGQQNIYIHDNTFIARTGPGYAVMAIGINPTYVLNSANINLNNLIENNLFKAIVETTDSHYAARAVSLEGIAPYGSLTFKNNIFESNQISLAIGGVNGSNADGVDFISNAFRKSAEGASRAYISIQAGGVVQNVKISDPIYEGGATSTIISTGTGPMDITMGWLLGVTVTDASGHPLSGATVNVYDSDETWVFSGVTDANGHIASQSNSISADGTGSLILLAQPYDADILTLYDGTHAATVFEFDNDSSVAPGHVAVQIGDTREDTMSNLVNAINAAADLNIAANLFGATHNMSLLYNMSAGSTLANQSVTTSCSALAVSGMSGSGVYAPIITTLYTQASTESGGISTELLNPIRITVSQAGYDSYDQDITLTQSQTIQVVLSSQSPPTVDTPAGASPNSVTGRTTSLTVLGADDGGESNLTYTWAATTLPSGAAAPSFAPTPPTRPRTSRPPSARRAITHSR